MRATPTTAEQPARVFDDASVCMHARPRSGTPRSMARPRRVLAWVSRALYTQDRVACDVTDSVALEARAPNHKVADSSASAYSRVSSGVQLGTVSYSRR
jgi:hypothetical protein